MERLPGRGNIFIFFFENLVGSKKKQLTDMQQSGAVSAADSGPSAVPVTHRYGCVTVRVRRLSQRQSNASDGSGALSEVQYSVLHLIKKFY